MDVPDFKKAVILVVEDEKPLANAISRKLQNHDFDVVTARTGQQALGYLEDLDEIDAVWLDHYLLGELSGLNVLAKVKEEGSRWQNVPVYIVSNSVDDEKVATYMKLGAEKYFIKSDSRLDSIVSELRTVHQKSA